MPKNKTYIILIIILLIFLVVMFFVFGDKKTKKDIQSFVSEEQDNATQEVIDEEVLLIVGKTTWKYQNEEWSFVANKKDKQTYNGNSFHIYDGSNSVGEYYLRYENKWIPYDVHSKTPKIENFLLAYSSNQDMKVLKLKEEVIEADSYVQQVLRDNEVPSDSQFSSIYKVSVDFDSDSILEDFYIISNAFPIDFKPEISFSMAFMVDDGEIHDIYTDVSPIVSLGTCKPFYEGFVDTNNDGISEVILGCGKFSATERIDMLYGFEYNHFKMLISNK